MSAEIKMEGMSELLSKLEEVGTKTANVVVKNALLKAGEYEADEMNANAPKRTGEMASSIKCSNVKSKNGIKYVEVSPDKEHFYYRFVNNGTSKMSANPFMFRTFAKTKKEIKAIIKNEIKKGLGL